MEIDSRLIEKIFSAIRSSYKIEKHVDFFIWLQGAVKKVLPHDMLLACWGEFETLNKKGVLNYDVASNVSDVSTQKMMEAAQEIDVVMRYLHDMWLKNDQRWFALNDLNGPNDNAIKTSLPIAFKQFNSLLVYGISDVRGSNECLYVFYSKENTFNVQNSVMGLVMPHIDSVLRKIQHLAPVDTNAGSLDELVLSKINVELSGRELEIVNWVRAGKTNQEIGDLLFISQNTVKSHLKRIFSKLNVTTRAQAVGKLLNS